ncbi:MAG: CinA family nicotinamide mononucleotide deamidase-related protein [Candidatus Adiutrix sp.]|jgi:nicotinamide-nucleotide amidase|nr:CinA family nicotinamide mononucleotide deamidase-related protein [Candidatus Adiutrix sp.]
MTTVSAEIISSGSELTLGRMVDTNSAWLSDFLGRLGVPTVRHTTVGDDFGRLVEAFQRGWAGAQVIVVTGGLGPTEDDLTRPAAAKAFGLELEFNETLAGEVRALFKSRGAVMTDNNLRQAWLPRSAIVVPNPIGTAPGFALAEAGRLMVFLPGVPCEMKIMAEGWLKPRLKEQFPNLKASRHTVVLNTAGLGESRVDALVGDLMAPNRNPAVGLLAGADMVKVLVTATGDDPAEAEALAAADVAEVEKRLCGHVFGYGEDTLPDAVAGLLKEQGLSLTILDAVTQGRLGGRLAPGLDPANWGGGQDLPRQPALSGALDILRLYAPDSAAERQTDSSHCRRHAREIRLIVAARPDPDSSERPEGHLSLLIECAVQSEALCGGRPQICQFPMGGEPHWALSRAAALSMFHLWRVLKGFAVE